MEAEATRAVTARGRSQSERSRRRDLEGVWFPPIGADGGVVPTVGVSLRFHGCRERVVRKQLLRPEDTGEMSGAGRSRARPPGASVPKMASHVKKIINISSFVTQSRANRSMQGASSRKSINIYGDGKIMEKYNVSSGKQTVPVFDEDGNNVTPQPLFQAEPGAAPPKQSKLFSPPDSTGVVTASDFFSTMSFQQTGINASFLGPFSRSTFGGSSMSISSQETESLSDDVEESGYRRDAVFDIHAKQDTIREQPKEEDLDKIINVYLTETETIWLLDMPAALVSTDSEEAELINVRNQTYTDLCKNRAGNDRYIDRMMQTFNGAPKSKEIQCDRIVHQDAGVLASVWDLYDSFNPPESPPVKEAAETTSISERSESVASSRSNMSRRTMSTTSMDRDVFSSTITDIDKLPLVRIQDETEPDAEEILKSEKFQQDLFIMERVVVENIYQPKLAAYRQLPVIIDPDAADDTELLTSLTSPSLNRLWSFVCDITKGRNVSSTSWNRKNPDLLAVGYGQFGFKEQKGGLACCWSLKNTTWPERIFHCESGVTALDFSMSSPDLLAVGMYNGTVAIYNVQNNDSVPMLDSSDNPNKHTCPVWQLKWVEQDHGSLGEDKGEILVSISADGRITRWRIRKGLDCNDLMRLKRTGSDRFKESTGDKEKKGVAFISRQAPGMCFDFLPTDSNVYLAGTEEGHIHKCSCSYNEQFLDTYRAHKGPVYKLAWSPFSPDVFLSCSADWCIHLWRQDILKPILTFSATTNAVHDIMWSPTLPLVFGAVNENRIEIWDLSVSTLDPIIVSSANPAVKLTTLLFAHNTNCVLIGDSDGQVSVYALRNVSSLDASQVNALYDLIGATLACQL
ncbi:dynein axonemal intermediate chain 4 isoform X2 [Mixophyes fleayi]|uniref:dynein axonemal intermediate chain 4 isoform X2 n=1 Tax=Mixophyes fleayi TaxID=3061075 RepID=UPI003F4E2D87